MIPLRSCSSRLAAGVALLLLPGVLAGCGDRDVVAEAGRTPVTRGELELFVASARGAGDDPSAALHAIAARARLAEAARRADLDEDPDVRARLAASRREILAAAYVEKALEESAREDALRKRFEAEKEKLSKRRIHVAHVVTRAGADGKDARDAAQARIIKAYARLAGGEPFEKVARELSEDSVTGPRGGDLGPLLEGEVDAKFFEAAVALAPGETSRPFESGFGFHIVKALEPVQTVTPTFEQARGPLAAEARREAEAALNQRLRDEIPVELHPERVGLKPGAAASGKVGEGR